MSGRKVTDELKRWIAALESGDYEQAKRQLTINTVPMKFCCYGVACDLYAKATGNGEWEEDEGVVRFVLGSTSYQTLPPAAVISNIGIPWITASSGVHVMLHGIPASEWNDERGATFTKIAGMLRSEYGLVDEDLTAYYKPRGPIWDTAS